MAAQDVFSPVVHHCLNFLVEADKVSPTFRADYHLGNSLVNSPSFALGHQNADNDAIPVVKLSKPIEEEDTYDYPDLFNPPTDRAISPQVDGTQILAVYIGLWPYVSRVGQTTTKAT